MGSISSNQRIGIDIIKKPKEATFTQPQIMLLANVIADELKEISKRVPLGKDGKGKLKIVFDDPECIDPEHRNDEEFIMGLLSAHIALAIVEIAADGFPLPPYNS